MSRKEREWLKVLERVKAGELSLRDASGLMKSSYRQCLRRHGRFEREGDQGLVHRGRARASNRGIDPQVKRAIIERYRERYGDFGPTLSAEKLATEGYSVDHETLRRWLIEEKLWKKQRKRSAHRSWRPRRSHFGELVQMDGSHHQWFEDRAPRCCLMNMVDDATGRSQALFDEQETTRAAMTLLWKWIERYGIPMALYTDRKNVYVPDHKTAARAEMEGQEALTQFGRACKSLGIRIIEAHSPQAKGRVERSNGTYQDRLVKELRLQQISDIDSANTLLSAGFIDQLNEKFAVEPQEPADYHRSTAGHELEAVLCIEEDRRVTDDWIVRFENRYYQLQRQSQNPPTSKSVKVRQYLNGQLRFHYRGQDIDYTELSRRPVRELVVAARPTRKGRSVPAADHPWRQSYKTIHQQRADQNRERAS